MRKNQIQGIINDFLDYYGYQNPLNHVWIKNKFEMNLKSGEIKYVKEDDLSKFYKDKRKWFLERIGSLSGKLKDFEEVKLVVLGSKEKLEVKYKGKKFGSESIYHNYGNSVYGRSIKKINLKCLY